MALRRIIFQIGVFAGCVACGLTLWRTFSSGNFDLLQTSIRAVGAGVAILALSLIIDRILHKLAVSTDEEHPAG